MNEAYIINYITKRTHLKNAKNDDNFVNLRKKTEMIPLSNHI